MELNQSDIDILRVNLQWILNTQHSHAQKRNLPIHNSKSLNFACPICGDSRDDLNKKRAHIYFNSAKVHCYNCGYHSNINSFFQRFGINLDISIKLKIYQISIDYFSKLNKREFDIDFNLIKETCPTLEFITKKLKLVPINKNDLFITSRNIKFGLDKIYKTTNGNNIYIFNVFNSYVMGYQIRTDNTSIKYIKRNLEWIYEHILQKPSNENVRAISQWSHYYGLWELDWLKPITVMESALDHFMFPNSVAISNVNANIDVFLDLPNVRFLFDNDTAGKNKSIELIKLNHSVFMWNKFIKHFGIDTYLKDYGDIINYAFTTKRNIYKGLGKWFSTSKIDLLHV